MIDMRGAIIACLLIASLLLTAACSSTTPCSAGIDVRTLDDSNIAASLKKQIFDPGSIIDKSSSRYPTGKLVVIRAASQEWPSSSAVTASYIDEIFFSTSAGTKSIRGYYDENSWGSFQVSKGSVPGWITLSKKLTDYTPGIEDNTQYMKDVLKLANVDWSALDANNNGKISRSAAQIVVLIPNAMPSPPTGFASTRDVLIGDVNTPDGTFDFGTRNVVYFSVKAAADPQFASNPIRTLEGVAHELGHAFFDLPDRYGANSGTGSYDIMSTSYTWTLLPMHDRMKIGWIKPNIIQGHKGDCLKFPNSEKHKAALIVVPPEEFLSPTGVLEYWIVENRNKASSAGGYDEALPESGLAIWYTATGTYSSGHDDVRLVQFDKADKDPDQYANPVSGAFFKRNDANHRRILLPRNGQWGLLFFQNVSDSGANMFGEF